MHAASHHFDRMNNLLVNNRGLRVSCICSFMFVSEVSTSNMQKPIFHTIAFGQHQSYKNLQ